MRYRRAQVKGGTYFFTVVTHNRKKIFSEVDNVELLRQAFKKIILNTFILIL
jgi:putative transposase